MFRLGNMASLCPIIVAFYPIDEGGRRQLFGAWDAFCRANHFGRRFLGQIGSGPDEDEGEGAVQLSAAAPSDESKRF